MKKLCFFGLTMLIGFSMVFAGGNGEVDSDTLVLYSPHKEILIELVVDMYEADTGKNVEVITAGTGELIARLKTEASNPNADVIWGGSMNTLLPEMDLFEPFQSKHESNVEDAFKNVEGKITRFSAIPSTIVVNTDRLAELCGPSARIVGYQSMIDLARTCPDIIGNISNANPNKSSSSFEQLVNQIWAFAYRAAEKELGRTPTVDEVTDAHLEMAWEDQKPFVALYDGKHSAGSGAVITDVVQGETAIGLSYEMAAGEAADNSDYIEIVYPVEGSVVKADAAAIIKGAKNMDNAKEFMDYLLTEKVQNKIKDVYRRAIIKTADFSGSPLAPLSTFSIIKDDSDRNNKGAMLERYGNIF